MSTYFRSKRKPERSKCHFSTLNGAHDLIGNTLIFEILTREGVNDEGVSGASFKSPLFIDEALQTNSRSMVRTILASFT